MSSLYVLVTYLHSLPLAINPFTTALCVRCSIYHLYVPQLTTLFLVVTVAVAQSLFSFQKYYTENHHLVCFDIQWVSLLQ